jgi:hypothetical protein
MFTAFIGVALIADGLRLYSQPPVQMDRMQTKG